jgi:hypothetical protein
MGKALKGRIAKAKRPMNSSNVLSHVKASTAKVNSDLVFIGVRKSGSRVTVSREVLRRSANGQFVTIASKMSKLPQKGSASKDKSVPRDWMRNPQLGDRLTNAFGKAVAAAKRTSTKSNK